MARVFAIRKMLLAVWVGFTLQPNCRRPLIERWEPVASKVATTLQTFRTFHVYNIVLFPP
jgi:hypothetical protein